MACWETPSSSSSPATVCSTACASRRERRASCRGIGGGWSRWTPRDYLANFALAAPYPFVAQLLVCYVGFYGLARVDRRAVFPITFFALFAPALMLPTLWGRDHHAAFHGFH